MKIFIFVLILGLCKVMTVKSDCDKMRIRGFNRPSCGHLPDCYQHAKNIDILDYYSCKRKENGLPDFTSKWEERCPDDKPQCSLSEST
ncbi:accessory gland protein Acp63F-like [Drosophila serrata]|uniref:accessory gland protein Acp63F-like n=1 Tax=Drosophila serrata TaxID=7274 RepID=UPI000A1CF497|nr:accessory gland protein Acp63F-like [Drosophila serrata]